MFIAGHCLFQCNITITVNLKVHYMRLLIVFDKKVYEMTTPVRTYMNYMFL